MQQDGGNRDAFEAGVTSSGISSNGAGSSGAFQRSQALAAVLQDDGNRDAFEAGDGPRLLLLLLDAAQSRSAGKQFSQLELLQILQLHGPLLLLLLLLLLDAARARSAGRPAYCCCCMCTSLGAGTGFRRIRGRRRS